MPRRTGPRPTPGQRSRRPHHLNPSRAPHPERPAARQAEIAAAGIRPTSRPASPGCCCGRTRNPCQSPRRPPGGSTGPSGGQGDRIGGGGGRAGGWRGRRSAGASSAINATTLETSAMDRIPAVLHSEAGVCNGSPTAIRPLLHRDRFQSSMARSWATLGDVRGLAVAPAGTAAATDPCLWFPLYFIGLACPARKAQENAPLCSSGRHH